MGQPRSPKLVGAGSGSATASPWEPRPARTTKPRGACPWRHSPKCLRWRRRSQRTSVQLLRRSKDPTASFARTQARGAHGLPDPRYPDDDDLPGRETLCAASFGCCHRALISSVADRPGVHRGAGLSEERRVAIPVFLGGRHTMPVTVKWSSSSLGGIGTCFRFV